MKITADKEGVEVIRQLCDVALRAGGLHNLAAITPVLQMIQELATPEQEKVPDKKET